MAEYETLRQGHLALLFEVLPQLLAGLTRPPDELRATREAALRAIVAHAKERSPWHGARLAAVDPERLTESGLRSLPTMTKDDLMTHFDEIVTDRRLTRDVGRGPPRRSYDRRVPARRVPRVRVGWFERAAWRVRARLRRLGLRLRELPSLQHPHGRTGARIGAAVRHGHGGGRQGDAHDGCAGPDVLRFPGARCTACPRRCPSRGSSSA